MLEFDSNKNSSCSQNKHTHSMIQQGTTQAHNTLHGIRDSSNIHTQASAHDHLPVIVLHD